MRTRQCALNVVLVGASLFRAPATFACDLSTYDRTPPTAIGSGLDNGIVNFQWATDVDTVGGRNWIWHYIKNLDPHRGLGYKWPKAELRRALGSPLDPGKTDCNRYFVTTQTAPDDNAPITYGTNDTPQRAAVYVESKAAPAGPVLGPGTQGGPASAPVGPAPVEPATGSIIETSYNTGAGSSENVRVEVSTSQGTNAGGQWLLHIERTPNVIVALGMKFLNTDQFRSLLERFGPQSTFIGAGDLRKITGRDDKEALSGLYSESELSARSNQPYFVLLSGGPPKTDVSVSASALRTISTDLILFDRERHPFFATTVRILAPNNAS